MVIRPVVGQKDLRDRYKEVPPEAWVKAIDAVHGLCFVKGCDGWLFYHNRQPRGSILFPVFEDGSMAESGEIIFPQEKLAVFKLKA